jgi:hypothetical protein
MFHTHFKYQLTGPRFAGSYPADSNGFLRVVEFRSTTSFGGEVKPSISCRKILRHVKDPLRKDRY